MCLAINIHKRVEFEDTDIFNANRYIYVKVIRYAESIYLIFFLFNGERYKNPLININ